MSKNKFILFILVLNFNQVVVADYFKDRVKHGMAFYSDLVAIKDWYTEKRAETSRDVERMRKDVFGVIEGWFAKPDS